MRSSCFTNLTSLRHLTLEDVATFNLRDIGELKSLETVYVKEDKERVRFVPMDHMFMSNTCMKNLRKVSLIGLCLTRTPCFVNSIVLEDV